MHEIAKNHHVNLAWDDVLRQVRSAMRTRGVHPSRTLVLVPYAQLMQEARQAWLRQTADDEGEASFLPRFETTFNWGHSLGGCHSGTDELQMDAARDSLTAQSLLRRAGLGSYLSILGPRLMEEAWGLARAAAAVDPAGRIAWAEQLAGTLWPTLTAPELALEAATARIALAWAGNSAYPTDPLFRESPDLLVVLQGFQQEALAAALVSAAGGRALLLPLYGAASSRAPQLHASRDAEDEAHRAAACVLSHLAAGRTPVALVAQDRELTRRVRSMLDGRGVAVRDETGWKLSTTRCAASVMSLLRACAWDVSADQMLDWLKHAPAFAPTQVSAFEATCRAAGVADWSPDLAEPALAASVQALREGLAGSRTLSQWLVALRTALRAAGQWPGLLNDRAGQAVVQSLRLAEGAESEFADVLTRLNLQAFVAWVDQTLEGSSYAPVDRSRAEVVILPLSQLLGRPLAAVVLPGCDELRLAVSPEPTGPWSPAQAGWLGLPSRQKLAQAARESWQYALAFPAVDLLWRSSEGGESLMPSGFVQELMLAGTFQTGNDPRVNRTLCAEPGSMPAPAAASLAMSRLSSTDYEDLRRCPYRFFALRQLRLRSADELDTELGKRDFGTWLHAVLSSFHEEMAQTEAPDVQARLRSIDAAADRATRNLGFSASEFLPFAAAWPQLRDGYLAWLNEHESSGAKFLQSEVWCELPLGGLTLVGKIDRLDRLSDGSRLVMDYKTEARSATSKRVSEPQEDIQLAFYAALLPDDSLSAAYVSVTEKEGTRSYAQGEIEVLRDRLVEGILSDMARISQGSPLPALGEGQACEFCAARGLCRRDFWDSAMPSGSEK